jgi:hypothetical protein
MATKEHKEHNGRPELPELGIRRNNHEIHQTHENNSENMSGEWLSPIVTFRLRLAFFGEYVGGVMVW